VQIDYSQGRGRFEPAQQRHLPPYLVETRQRQLHIQLGRQGQQMEHRIGGAADSLQYPNSVVYRGLTGDVAEADAFPPQLDHAAAAGPRQFGPLGRNGGQGAASGER
jgi:hypothetical protein